MQILQTDVHTSPLRISWENLIKDHGIFSMMIILLILITLSLDSVWILLGENCFWSLLGLKGLTKPLEGFRTSYQVQPGVKQFNLRDMPAFSSYTNYTKLKRASVWCVLPLKLFHLFSPTKYYLVLKISQISWLSKKQELFLTLILGIVNYQLEVAIATPKTARH